MLINSKPFSIHFSLFRIMLFATCFTLSLNCPYSSYNDAVISESQPMQIWDYEIPQIDYSITDSIGFGFWSQSIPQWKPKTTTYYGDQDFKENIQEGGQQLLLIIGDKELKLVCKMRLNWASKKVVHQFEIYTRTLELYYQFQFEPINYEGVWIFTFISFQIKSQTISLESTGQKRIQISVPLIEEKLKFVLGGRTFQVFLVEYEEGSYDADMVNLNYFNGRISNLFIADPFIYDNQKFDEYQSLCKVPSKFEGQQTINLVQGLKIFKGETELKFAFEQTGNKFCLFGWFKIDFSYYISIQYVPMIRITTQKNHGHEWLDGDELLYIYLYVYVADYQYVGAIVLRDTHIMPIQANINQFKGTTDNYAFYGDKSSLSEWHFLKYEYNMQMYNQQSLLEIFFFNGLGLKQWFFQGQQLTNSKYYISIGSDTNFASLFQGSIFGLNFIFNYEEDKQFNNLLTCHYSCHKCNGPLENNCISCATESNRHFLSELSQCKCSKGYFEVGVQVCESFSSYFSQIIQIEQSETYQNFQCQFSYFYFPLKNNAFTCIQCPEIIQNQYYCIDCILNPQAWYIKPICTQDIISLEISSDASYSVLQRELINQNVYFIDENGQITFYPGLQNICDTGNLDNCFLSDQKHLGQYLYVQCKENYFYKNGKCNFLSASCLKADSQGKCEKFKAGAYEVNGDYFECSYPCLACTYKNDIKDVVCFDCIEQYTLSEGICYQCGQFCQYCEKYNDVIAKTTYFRCFRCIDDSIYFLSFDGINCLRNSIKYCLYAFQSDINDITLNTLDLNFTQRLDSSNIVTHCARCKAPMVYYLMSEQICVSGYYANCITGLVEQTCDIPVTDDFVDQCNNFDYYTNDGGITKYYYVTKDDGSWICTTSLDCLIDITNAYGAIQFSDGCPNQIKYCQICIFGNLASSTSLFLQYLCLYCDSGYYAERLSGKCYPCPVELNCFSCFQQQIKSQDYWKIKIRPFYSQAIDIENLHSFVQYAQSDDINDYEIKCNICQQGFELYQNNCIESCPTNCFECIIINGQNKCVKCYSNIEGRTLSLYNNQCIDCPSNCALCSIRSQYEIFLINPLFNNQKFQRYSSICLQSFNDKNYYYEQNFKSFVDCKIFQKCQQSYFISLNLFCSINDYDFQFSQFTNQQDQQKFQQSNIFIDDLVSGNSFQKFENDIFYQLANSKQIRTIIIEIKSNFNQICSIQQAGVIKQQFSQNIFTAIEVQLHLISTQQQIISIESSLVFKDFSSIEIQGFIFEINPNKLTKQIIFSSAFYQTIELKSLLYRQSDYIQDQSLIQLNNISNLQINDFQINNVYISNIENFFNINQSEQHKNLVIQNFTITNSSFVNTSVLKIYAYEDDVIQIKNLTIIQCNFINSTFFQTVSENNFGNLEISQINLEATITSSIMFNFFELDNTYLEDFQIMKSQLTNSTLFIINQNVIFDDFQISQCFFQKYTTGIINQKQLSSNPIEFKFRDLQISDNQYTEDSSFIKLSRFITNFSKLEIQNFQFQNNFNYYVSREFNIQSTFSTLIYFELDEIIINQLQIIRGVGIPEITVVDTLKLNFFNIIIEQSDQFKFLGLHQFVDCLQQQVKGFTYPQSLRIYGAKFFNISNISIFFAQTINFPIIQYNSIGIIQKQQNEELLISNVYIQNCLLILTQSETDLSIIKIYSEQDTNIQMQNLTFIANLLQEYVQDSLHPSALSILIYSYLGKISFTDCQFIQNTVLNSTDSIIYINSNSITISNCQFDFNGLYNYSIIQKYLLWGFTASNQPYQEDLENIFKIKSTTGNGQLIGQKISLVFCQISNSQGTNGGGFMLQAKKSATIEIRNLQCIYMCNTFNEQIETGGCFHIDSLSVSELNLQMENIIAQQIHSRYQGGLLFLDTGNNKINLNLTNITVKDIYAQQGSILYIKSSQQIAQQLEVISNKITAIFTNEGIVDYCDKYFKTSILESEQMRLINNMTLFYFENSKFIVLENIFIKNLILQSFVKVEIVQQFLLLNFSIIDSSISNNLITVNSNTGNKIFVGMESIKITNVKVGIQSLNYNYDYPNKSLIFQSFKCLQEIQRINISKILDYKNLNHNQNFGRYLIMKLFGLLNLENSNLIQLLSMNNECSIRINYIQLSNISCSSCSTGLLYFEFQDSDDMKSQSISNIVIQNSECGQYGCLNFIKQQKAVNRILQRNQKQLVLTNFEIILNKLQCTNNMANFGTCLYLFNLKVLIDNSKFSNNIAKFKGGAIYFFSKKDLIITSTEIIENSATIGGGIHFYNQNEIDYLKLGTIFLNNSATFYGNDVSSIPSKLAIAFGESNNYLQTISVFNDQNSIIDSVVMYVGEGFVSSLKLPSGQKISEYSFFDWQRGQYLPFNKKFRLIAFNSFNDVMKNLSNSYCNINSRYLNLSQNQSTNNFQFTNNYTNIQQVYFDTTTQDYNLDDLVIYFDNETPNEIVLQLQFNCSSIVIPKYRQQIPYNIIGYHQNYQLNLNVKSYACQYGEIKNKTNYSCQICDSLQGQFQLKLNQEKCEIKDDVSTISVNSAQLNLREGYWRPYFDTSVVTYCLNLPLNCMGGWNEGNLSCVRGHIGALCEQCDLYNIRGDGRFSVSYKYSCGSCLKNNRNAIIIIFVSLWTFISILISVNSTLKVFEQRVRKFNIKSLGLIVNSDIKQSGILIKILTNYFQIISSLSTFQLSFQIEINTAINTFGSPIQTMIYSLDCFLINIFQFQIHYARVVWQLIMPIIYICIFFFIYFIGIRTRILQYNQSVISTTLIYMYIYLQPSLVGGLVELLSFRDISGYKWILANVSYLYDSPIHLEWMAKFCFPTLLLLAFLIPLYFFYGLYANSNNLNDKACRLKWGYLYNEYKPQAYFWDIVKIVKKELMIIFLTYYTENVIMKASILVFILAVYLDFNLNNTPYVLAKLNQLDYLATTICIKSIILALGIYIAKISDAGEVRIVGLVILFFLNAKFILSLLLKIVEEFLISNSSFFDSKLDMVSDFLKRKFVKLNRYPFMRSVLKNRAEHKQKMRRLFQKLKIFLIQQAREIMTFKHYQIQMQTGNQFYSLENCPSSLRNPTLTLDRQQLITKSIRESLNQTKNSIPSSALSKIKLKHIALLEDKDIKSANHHIVSQSAKFASDEKNEEYEI